MITRRALDLWRYVLGIESTIRRSIVQESAFLRDSGMNIVRVNIPAATVMSNAETASLMDHVSLWCGPSTSLAAMPVRRGKIHFDSLHRAILTLRRERMAFGPRLLPHKERNVSRSKWYRSRTKHPAIQRVLQEFLTRYSKSSYVRGRSTRLENEGSYALIMGG